MLTPQNLPFYGILTRAWIAKVNAFVPTSTVAAPKKVIQLRLRVKAMIPTTSDVTAPVASDYVATSGSVQNSPRPRIGSVELLAVSHHVAQAHQYTPAATTMHPTTWTQRGKLSLVTASALFYDLRLTPPFG